MRLARYLLSVALLVAVYYGAALFGLSEAFENRLISLVWPATGISLAATVLFGYRMLPGIFIGALLSNYRVVHFLPLSLSIAAGNTLEALIGAYLLKKLVQFRYQMDRITDVLGFIVLGTWVATAVSATFGIGAMQWTGFIASAEVERSWFRWWLGNSVGALVVAPVLFLLKTKPKLSWTMKKRFEAVALVALIAGLEEVVFKSTQRPYLFFPLVVWATVRFELGGAVLSTFLVSVLAIWQTLAGRGPFVRHSPEESLFVLEAYLGFLSGCALSISAALSERRRVEEQNRRLASSEAAQKEFQFLARVREDTVATVSHDLKTPITAIQLSAKAAKKILARDPLLKGEGQVLFQLLDHIELSSNRCYRLIHDLLDFAKLESGSFKIHKGPVHIGELARDCADMFRPLIIEKRLRFEVRLRDPSVVILCDKERVGQVLSNLVGNAVKFTPEGGKISLVIESNEAEVRFLVQDNGPGMSPEDQQHLFERYWQAKSAAYQGSGLGLSIASGIITAHGGRIWAESEAGKGSKFFFTLPYNEKIAKAA